MKTKNRIRSLDDLSFVSQRTPKILTLFSGGLDSTFVLKELSDQGVDFVLTLMVNRDNVNGGESATYAQDGLTLRACVTLKEAGDFIFLNDKLMKHDVQPISRLNPAKECSRDMLIAMFTQRPAASS
jgi:hypothetical protein